MDDNYDITLKLLIVGGSGVGKTNFVNRFWNNEFNQMYMSTTGVDSKSKVIELKNKKVRIQIWDTAGQEKYKAITKNLFLKVMGALILYDITDESSFEKLKTWVSTIKEECGRHMQMIIVGNKSDLDEQRKMDKEDAMNFAKEQNIEYIECSSKTGENVLKAVSLLCEKILDINDVVADGSFMLDASLISTPVKKKKCCK